MCLHTAMYVSSYYYTSVLILLYMSIGPRNQEHLLMSQGVDALEAAKIVAQQSKDSG